MATWHPPIPAKKLYSKEALDLGAGLALLIWCYDGIERDGHVDIELNKLTAEFSVSYRTMKDWWAALRDGPFFRKKEDRGRKGWRVWLANEWIDWHVMGNNYPDVEGQNIALEQNDEGPLITLEELEVPLKSRSSPAEGQNIALENSAYKEDQHDQKSERHADAMFSAVARACRIDTKLCTNAQRNQVAQTAKALSKAGKLPEDIPKVETWWYAYDWRGKKGEAPRPAQLQEVWQQAMTQEQRNGTLQSTDRNGRKQYTPPTPEWSGFKASDPDKPL